MYKDSTFTPLTSTTSLRTNLLYCSTAAFRVYFWRVFAYIMYILGTVMFTCKP